MIPATGQSVDPPRTARKKGIGNPFDFLFGQIPVLLAIRLSDLIDRIGDSSHKSGDLTNRVQRHRVDNTNRIGDLQRQIEELKAELTKKDQQLLENNNKVTAGLTQIAELEGKLNEEKRIRADLEGRLKGLQARLEDALMADTD